MKASGEFTFPDDAIDNLCDALIRDEVEVRVIASSGDLLTEREVPRRSHYRCTLRCGVSPFDQHTQRNHYSGNGDPLASRWFSSLLALQILSSQWSAKDIRRDSPARSGDEPRQSILGRTAHPRRVTQARYRRRPDDRGKIHGEEKAATVTGLEDVSSQSYRCHRLD